MKLFEAPSLTKIGNTSDVILGIATLGSDLDLTLIVNDLEFCEDPEIGF